MIDKIREDLNAALKAQEKLEVSTLRMLLSELKSAQIDKRRELSEEEALAVAQKAVKKRKEAAEQYQNAGRQELAEKEMAEAGILNRYLPEQMSPEELRKLAEEAIKASGASGPKEMGKVMGILMPQVKGRADGNQVREVVTQVLGGQ